MTIAQIIKNPNRLIGKTLLEVKHELGDEWKDIFFETYDKDGNYLEFLIDRVDYKITEAHFTDEDYNFMNLTMDI